MKAAKMVATAGMLFLMGTSLAGDHPMGYFITSVGLGQGGNLGGLAGADAYCTKLAEAAGSTGRTWRAYLSTQTQEQNKRGY